MQLLGTNLKDLRQPFSRGKFSIETIIIIGLQLVNRLKSIHSVGYAHRDLKPANIVIGKSETEANFIYLIDFGLSKELCTNVIAPESLID